MSVLQDSSLFISQVHNRAHHFIQSGIWQSVEEARLTNWIRQFEQYDAELLGAVLLDNLILKSKPQFKAMLSTLMTCAELCVDMQHDRELVGILSRSKDPGVRLAPAISLEQPPTKSGFYVLRLLQRMYRIKDDWLAWPQRFAEIPKSVKTLIVVDDFLGSGDQFSDFVSLSNLSQLHKDRPELRIVYLVAAAHQSGIDILRRDFSFVEIICGDVLTDDFHLFDGTRLNSRYRTNVAAQLKEQYLELLKKAGMPPNGKVHPFGYKQQGVCYAFEHSTPNNTLPIYWYETEYWTTLLDR
ncbi:phosphoribosyltransferase-like protein [Duganella levis]|uniref:PRTase-CE domain-containing protein n=1 Tax=Duganella levis TaxID=2692169 RepID=A0ABW9W4Q6_9BURK|nr:hypothetical protein [Duganella levis]MYN28926.1 hypothetical protein [Duganella levis]